MAAAPKLRLAVRRSLSAAALTAATLAGAAPAEPPAPTSGRRLALLIGVNEYDAVPDLRGAVNDVELLRSVLSSKAGFAERDIELLLDRAATRRGIFEAIDRLAARAKPSDVVYVHYSGHGSQVKDLNGDEADGLDETLVPTNGRTKNVADITDDELAERLARVRAESVAIVLDACHSGTGTRRVLQRRSVPRDERSELYAQNATRAVVPIAGKRHVLMSGAASDEEALDGPVDGRPHGLFSYALARSLGRLGPEASPRDLFAGAGSELERIKAQLGLHRLPEPQLEGDERRLASPLFATRAEAPAPARLPWVPALRRGPGHALLRGAVALGAAPGSLWAVYGPDEREFAPGVALAEAEVVEHAGADAIARFTPAEAAFAPGARAVLIAPPLPDEAIPVRVAAPDPARAARLQNALRAKLPTLRFTAPGEFARFHLELAGERWQLLGADGRSEVVPLANEDEGSVVAAIAAQLERSLSAAELLALDNPASGFAITLGLVAPEGTSFRVRMPGEPRLPENSLQLRVSTPRACSLTLVDVDSAGLVQVIFPNPISEQHGYAPGGRLEAGATLDIPDSLASPNRAGFFVDYAPPTGIDTVRAFCATDPRAATALRRAIAQIPAERSATSRAAVRSALLAARGALTRGVRIVADGAAEEMPPDEALPASSDWAASSLTVRVAQ